MKKFITNVKAVAIVLGVILLIVGCVYLDYTIYTAKYPNTTVWMYLLDSRK